jgi:hypothetical protein
VRPKKKVNLVNHDYHSSIRGVNLTITLVDNRQVFLLEVKEFEYVSLTTAKFTELS